MFNSSKYLFILANPGAGGHRLGRIISCINNVYWYTSIKNGINPWDIFFTDKVAGKNISQYHYDRLVGDQSIPLVGERIERWWREKDIDYFYNNVWAEEIKKFQPILETKYIHWVLHDTPQNILKRFPNSKIISLIDSDINEVVNRFMETTARFPCFYQHKKLKPDYLNEYAKAANAINKIKPGATEKDLWLFQNYNAVDNYDVHYKEYVYSKIYEDNNNRSIFEDSRCIKITWTTFNIDQVIKFLKATDVDTNYKKLINIS